ncbi:MAG: T9SS type A sorting domain-containing protein [Candidatus Marinimicrobia bacterium]|nr:T9SS type A sorting domain-containing protein [Candidatus Neomarinimicrobiota bacterium]
MNKSSYTFFPFLVFLLLFKFLVAENVVIVIIDGARYSETFGDVNHTFIPVMDSLSQFGTTLDQFYNDSLTYTSRAVPALWCGAWTGVRDTIYNDGSTQYTLKPSLFEYFRKQTTSPPQNAYYILEYVSSLWLPSFHNDYGPDYWPTFISTGSMDIDVLGQALQVINNDHPQLLLVYLADVDHGGHSGNWNTYTQAIATADSIVGVLWRTIQQDTVYANNTTLLVTNDHGRHDDSHGGFNGHGDGCNGCRHIMFLALGPQIESNLATSIYRRTPDMAVTAAHILQVTPEFSTGDVINEIFSPVAIEPDTEIGIPERFHIYPNYPNPFNPSTTIEIDVYLQSHIRLTIVDINGKDVVTLMDTIQNSGRLNITWNGKDKMGNLVSAGIYLYQIQSDKVVKTQKMILIK